MTTRDIRRSAALCLAASAIYIGAHEATITATGSQERTESSKAGSVYQPLTGLLGDWRLINLPKEIGTPPRMTFEWDRNRTHLRYRSFRPDGRQEYEGTIAWHPVKKRFVFLKTYVTEGSSVLMEDGWVEPLSEGGIRFHMHTHYTAGMTLPWSDGAISRPEGTTLRFRRTLVPQGDDTLLGDFVMLRKGKWIHPDFGFETPKSGFEWKRVPAPRP